MSKVPRVPQPQFLGFTAAALAALFFLTGCPDTTTSNPTGTSAKPAAKTIRAALALDIAGVDDKSFNAASWSGLQRAQRELGLGPDGIKYIEARDPSDYKTNMAAFATQGYDLVFAGSYAFDDAMKEVAPQFPAVKFAVLDGNAPASPNAASLNFREEQATFLAGFLAAAMSKTGKIGFIGGKDIPLIKKFEAGYCAGATTGNANVKVLRSYTGDWNDVSKGKSQADQQFGNGADIIFHAAGKAGLGVIEAAKNKGKGFYAIGVDSDQDGIAPGRVLTSVVKRVDVAVFDTVKRTKEGKFVAGRQVYDLASGGVGLTEMKYTKQDVPAAVLARLQKVQKQVSSGEIVPPTTMQELSAWKAPQVK